MLCNKSCNKCVVTLHYFAYLLGKLDDTKYRGRDSSGIDYKGTSRYYIHSVNGRVYYHFKVESGFDGGCNKFHHFCKNSLACAPR